MQGVLGQWRMVSKVLALGRDDELGQKRRGVPTPGMNAEQNMEGRSVSTPGWDAERGAHCGDEMLYQDRRDTGSRRGAES